MLTVLDLFSGIGGFSLGLERTGGFKTVAFCEIDPFCRKVLAKHWPGVPIHDEIKTLAYATGERCKQRADAGRKRAPHQQERQSGIRGELGRCGENGLVESSIHDGPIDVICGGFPCQDISTAGRGVGIEGSRSGLWSEYARLIGEIRPRYVIVENVAALLGRGLDRVLGDLASIGYDAEWHCIPASAVGAPHRRDRVWIVAYPQHPDANGLGSHRENSHTTGQGGEVQSGNGQGGFIGPFCEVVSDPHPPPMQRPTQQRGEPDGDHAGAGDVADADEPRLEGWLGRELSERAGERVAGKGGTLGADAWWRLEPDVGRVAHGVPKRVDRLRSLGNAVVPQVVELIGNAILSLDPPAR